MREGSLGRTLHAAVEIPAPDPHEHHRRQVPVSRRVRGAREGPMVRLPRRDLVTGSADAGLTERLTKG